MGSLWTAAPIPVCARHPIVNLGCASSARAVAAVPLSLRGIQATGGSVILELRHRPAGLGYQRQRWPRAVHHIMRFGRSEARLIVEDGEQPTMRQVVVFLIAAILTNQ